MCLWLVVHIKTEKNTKYDIHIYIYEQLLCVSSLQVSSEQVVKSVIPVLYKWENWGSTYQENCL